MHIYLNGHMVDQNQAHIRVDDAGLQHAVGLFETIGVYHGRAFRLHDHLDRLQASAATLGLIRQLDTDQLQSAVEQTISYNQLDRARVRVTVTAGPVSLLASKASDATTPDTPDTPDLTILVVASEPTVYDPAYFQQGITVLIAPPAANPFDLLSGHKTLSYWGRLQVLRQAANVGAGEAIWLNVTNHLASGAISNLFLVKGGALYTPFARGEEADGALPAPVLPGITRKSIIELAETAGITVHRQMLGIDDLLGADEVFLTNSSWLVLPVTGVEKKQISDKTIGPITADLRAALLKRIEQETTAAS